MEVALERGARGEGIAPSALEVDRVGQHEATIGVGLGEDARYAVARLDRRPGVDPVERPDRVVDEVDALDRRGQLLGDHALVFRAQPHRPLDPGGARHGELAAAGLRRDLITERARALGLRRRGRIEAERVGDLGGGLAAGARIEQRERLGDAERRDELVAVCGPHGAIERNAEVVVRPCGGRLGVRHAVAGAGGERRRSRGQKQGASVHACLSRIRMPTWDAGERRQTTSPSRRFRGDSGQGRAARLARRRRGSFPS